MTLRADAARNRAAIVEAARAVFAEQGLDAPLDEIAKRAGTGNATLYRRFPPRGGPGGAGFAGRMGGGAGAGGARPGADDPRGGGGPPPPTGGGVEGPPPPRTPPVPA